MSFKQIGLKRAGLSLDDDSPLWDTDVPTIYEHLGSGVLCDEIEILTNRLAHPASSFRPSARLDVHDEICLATTIGRHSIVFGRQGELSPKFLWVDFDNDEVTEYDTFWQAIDDMCTVLLEDAYQNPFFLSESMERQPFRVADDSPSVTDSLISVVNDTPGAWNFLLREERHTAAIAGSRMWMVDSWIEDNQTWMTFHFESSHPEEALAAYEKFCTLLSGEGRPLPTPY